MFTLAIYIVFGSIPNWLYVVIAVISGSIHIEYVVNKLDVDKKNNYSVHIHTTDKELADAIDDEDD